MKDNAVKHFSSRKHWCLRKLCHFMTVFVKRWQSAKREFFSGDWQRNTTKYTKTTVEASRGASAPGLFSSTNSSRRTKKSNVSDTKMEFNDHSNYVIESHETVSRKDRLINLRSVRQKVVIKRFVLRFLRALRVLRGGLMVGQKEIFATTLIEMAPIL